jgi:hypothetical protein
MYRYTFVSPIAGAHQPVPVGVRITEPVPVADGRLDDALYPGDGIESGIELAGAQFVAVHDDHPQPEAPTAPVAVDREEA